MKKKRESIISHSPWIHQSHQKGSCFFFCSVSPHQAFLMNGTKTALKLSCVQSDTKRVEKNKNIRQLILMEQVENTNECLTSSSLHLTTSTTGSLSFLTFSHFNVLTCAPCQRCLQRRCTNYINRCHMSTASINKPV